MVDPNARDADRDSSSDQEASTVQSSIDGVRAGRGRRRSAGAGYSIIELLAVVAVLLILAALAGPVIMGSREKAKGKECDRLFHALDSEIHNALDDLIFTSTEVIDIVLKAHKVENDPNPRTKENNTRFHENAPERAFVQTFDPSDASTYVEPGNVHACQVVFSGADVLSVAARQARTAQDEGGAERTFTIGLQ
jgi:prepilin-type N-terminal cleavage/methylation domain-containing protein